MKVGFVGLGKLGIPCALAAARHHDVVGTDALPHAKQILESGRYPHREVLVDRYMLDTKLRYLDTVREVVAHSEIVFVSIQTPHHPMYEGVTRVPETKSDFDYGFLKNGVEEICYHAVDQKKHVVLAIVSTVLPGTVDRELAKVLDESVPYVKLVYNPFFIAMGTTIRDYLAPEFVLLGVDDADAAERVERFYKSFVSAPVRRMSVRSAELTKVAYNTYIGLKIVLANTVMQICESTEANCDDVMGALGAATDRLISRRYLAPGLGDGGGCHPRDNIAMSWLAVKVGLGYDLFGDVMRIREKQTEWVARVVGEEAADSRQPIVILGKSFKPESNLTVGSCATLLAHLIDELDIAREVGVSHYDPEVDGPEATIPWGGPSVFVIATPHDVFKKLPIPEGSTIVDPWGFVRESDYQDVFVRSLGRF